MPLADPESPEEGFFNDLSQQVPDADEGTGATAGHAAQKDDAASKQKRIACVLCRKRKLRCDGARPTCGTCKRLSHDCAYDEVRKKSGPKRGYVKLLEARLQQVESLLKNHEPAEQPTEAPPPDPTAAYVASTIQQGLPNSADFLSAPEAESRIPPAPTARSHSAANGTSTDAEFPWEMIGLGLDEPLPPQDVQDELYQIYFTKIHPSVPVIHRPRFMAAMNLAPHMRPPVCLRYSMWTLAASVADKYDALQEHFYQRSRKYAQADEMKGHGESTITLAHCQSWALTATYEFKQMYFPRAWLSAGRASRLAQMMQLHRLDGVGLDVKQCLPPPKDWTEREERRRTFWMTFNVDRYASIGTGWPMTYDERDILTNLPCSDEAFQKSKPVATGSLEQTLSSNAIDNMQPFAGVVLTAALFGRNLLHLHRPASDDNDDDLNGGFWTRHREIEGTLLRTSLGLPDHLRLPSGSADANTVFMHMCIHTSTICLHQAAIFKAEKYRLPVNVSTESKIRCVTAASEIASIMRMISHLDLAAMNPFISFCIYVAARVFVQYLKTRPKDQQMQASLQFLLTAMQALRRKNPLTESFLVQLDLDLESAGVQGVQQKSYQRPQPVGTSIATVQANSGLVECGPLFRISESQNPNHPTTQYRDGERVKKVQQSNVRTWDQHGGMPFHVSSISRIEVDAQNAQYVSAQTGPGDVNVLPLNGYNLGDSTEMDLTPDSNVESPPTTVSNAGSQSRSHSGGAGSSSHTSGYSPGQPVDQIPYRPSPQMVNQTPNHSGSTLNNLFYSTSNDMLNANFAYGNADGMAGGDAIGIDLGMCMGLGSEWEIGSIGGVAGMTPMSDGTYYQMLESMSMGWDSAGPPHMADPGTQQGR